MRKTSIEFVCDRIRMISLILFRKYDHFECRICIMQNQDLDLGRCDSILSNTELQVFGWLFIPSQKGSFQSEDMGCKITNKNCLREKSVLSKNFVWAVLGKSFWIFRK